MSNFTIQDILLKYGDEFLEKYHLSQEQQKVFYAIKYCKTKELGFHTISCDNCGKSFSSFNSCRNRHCPMCQSYAREIWINRESKNILNCPYFHIVTTIPSELNELTLYNQRIIFNILFKATSESILELAQDPKWLGAKVGITSILHTWGSTLQFHPHIHSIVTGGGLYNNKWISCKENYLFQVQTLSSLFKGKFLYYLKHDFNNLVLKEDLNDMKSFNKFLEPLYSKTWITYIQPPKSSNVENVIEYVGRYSFRIAISNQRIKSIDNHKITFEYKNYKKNAQLSLMTLDALEFLRRFFLHVLPYRFTKIKHYRILTNRSKKRTLNLIRFLIQQTIFSDFTISLKRHLKQLVCKECGSVHFTYSYHYDILRP